MDSNTNVMYIHVCHVSCRVVVMFTCTLVRSHPDSALGVKLEPSQKTARDRAGHGNKIHARTGLSLSPERDHEGIIREVP
jgi:hypothetical protein